MRYLSLAALLAPLLCCQDGCPWVWVCILASIAMAATLYLVLGLADELRLLAKLPR